MNSETKMNSALNPEAPEFFPHLSSSTKLLKCYQDKKRMRKQYAYELMKYSQQNMKCPNMISFEAEDGYSAVNKTIKFSNLLPIGASHELFKTFTDFNSIASQLSKNVVVQSNQIIVNELPAVKLKSNDDDYNIEKIIDVNDSMLDRANINQDTLNGVNKPDEKFLDSLNPLNVDAWSKQTRPVIAKIQVGSTTFIGAKNVLRPQLTFKDTIDNSNSLWVPKISDKPNNIKPLALNILYNDDGEAVGYEHPYQVELDLYNPPAEFTDPDPEPPTFPTPLASTPFTFIDTEAQLDDLIKHLEGVKEIAVDLEHHSYRTYQGITCLIQITTSEGGDFIIDTLAVREHIHKLNQAFTDPKKIKVFHGADCDVLWLQRDFGVYIVGLFDTYQAAKTLNFSGLSFKYLLLKYCGVNADKKYQLADWRIRPLPSELVEYARMDTHYLLYIWRQLKAELLEWGGGYLHDVLDLSRKISLQTYKKSVLDDNSHLRLYVRSKKSFNSQQMQALQLLYKWRDAQARALDESTMYLLPNHMLVALADALPREVQGVNAICSPMPPFVKQNLITIHRMILSCREMPSEPQLYQMPSSLRQMVSTQTLTTNNVHDLTHVPDFREDQIKVDKVGDVLEEYPTLHPQVPAFQPHDNSENSSGIVSALNADAELFIPPYDRYRKYRTLAQVEEIKAFKDKEAKVAAISKGNELIKQEVLIKIQQAKTQAEMAHNDTDSNLTKKLGSKNKNDNREVHKRKRKICNEKVERKDKVAVAQITDKVKAKNLKVQVQVKPSKDIYQSVDYTKFHDEHERPAKAKAHNQPKMKFKKH